jgi:hypothetical protein
MFRKGFGRNPAIDVVVHGDGAIRRQEHGCLAKSALDFVSGSNREGLRCHFAVFALRCSADAWRVATGHTLIVLDAGPRFDSLSEDSGSSIEQPTENRRTQSGVRKSCRSRGYLFASLFYLRDRVGSLTSLA